MPNSIFFSREERGFESKSVTDTRATTDKNGKMQYGFGRMTKNTPPLAPDPPADPPAPDRPKFRSFSLFPLPDFRSFFLSLSLWEVLSWNFQ